VLWRDPGQRCHFARSVQWPVAWSPQCVCCKRNVDPSEEWKSLGENSKRIGFTWKKEIFLKGWKTNKTFGSRGHGLHARVEGLVFCVFIVSGTVIHFWTFLRDIRL